MPTFRTPEDFRSFQEGRDSIGIILINDRWYRHRIQDEKSLSFPDKSGQAWLPFSIAAYFAEVLRRLNYEGSMSSRLRRPAEAGIFLKDRESIPTIPDKQGQALSE